MWQEIVSDSDLVNFMNEVCHFHDGCLKELHYISGAYVNDDLTMYPINDQRLLRVIIQRQYTNNSTIELEFSGLKFLNLFPVDSTYTCEIQKSVMFFKNDYIYWCDHEDFLKLDLNDFEGTIICAKKMRWRSITPDKVKI